VLGLLEKLARVPGEGQLLLTLEQLAAGVGLVVARLGDRVAKARGDRRLRLADLRGKGDRLGLEFGTDFFQFGVGPRLLAGPHRKVSGTRARRGGHGGLTLLRIIEFGQ
jgi:hypothetical protein